ncbi:response regulator transcription factor [Amycolatopsis sp. NPDC058278]|uniref:response regulator transcription factor n=1 Tax=Amycolatopsis sp. NPDC058278 TaxID=3346417 RepID=UPI0036DF56CE
MPPISSKMDEGREREIVDLLRRAQAHQREAQLLIARVEEITQRVPAVIRNLPGYGDTMTWGKFTGRERSVAKLLTQGMSNRTIARRLAISERTVKNHLNSIFHKLGVADRTQAVIVLIGGAGQ